MWKNFSEAGLSLNYWRRPVADISPGGVGPAAPYCRRHVVTAAEDGQPVARLQGLGREACHVPGAYPSCT